MIFLSKDIDRYIELVLDNKPHTFFGKVFLVLSKPSLLAIAVYRYGYWTHNNTSIYKYFRYFFSLFFHIFQYICFIRGKFQIYTFTPIGPGLILSDKGCIVIGANTIGENVTVSHNVTIGMDLNGGTSTIGNGVVIYNDSIVYGSITIGDNSVIGAETVLTKTIPGSILIKGNPARVKEKNVNSHEHAYTALHRG